jgi:hypothetical protein
MHARVNRVACFLATDQVIPTMRQHLFAVVLLSAAGNCALAGGSWVFQPSTYSHDPQSGERATQYAAKPPAYGPSDPTYEQSAYIHKRTSLRGVGGSVERRHYVETWGAGEAIRPYGEWQRPFRAGATPYGPWGNPNGPWTSPFDSWVNPYGLGKLPTPPWYPWYPRTGYPGTGHPGGGYPGGGYPGHPGTGYPPHGGGPIAVPYGGQGGPTGQPGVGAGSEPGGMHGQAPATPGGAQHGQQAYAPQSGSYAVAPQSPQHAGPSPAPPPTNRATGR